MQLSASFSLRQKANLSRGNRSFSRICYTLMFLTLAMLWLSSGAEANPKSTAQISAIRLSRMAEAAAKLQTLAEMHPSINTKSKGVSGLLGILCQPDEAKSLSDLSTEDYTALAQYARSLNTVNEIFSEAGDRATSQAEITDNVRDLGACFDATLWSMQATGALINKMILQMPEMETEPKLRKSIDNVWTIMAVALEGGFEGFMLDGIGEEWCAARIAPALALSDVIVTYATREDLKSLQKAAAKAEKCSDAAKSAFRPLQEKFAARK